MLFDPAPKSQNRIQLRISERRLLLMAGDAMAVIVSVLVALLLWAYVAEEPFTFEFIFPQSFWFFVLTVLWFLLASANDFYDLRLAARRGASLQRLVLITLQLIVVYLIVFFVSERNSLPRLFILYYGVISFVLVALWRLMNPALIGWAATPRRVLIVGTDWAAETIVEAMTQAARDTYVIKGIIGEPDRVGDAINDIPIIGTGADVLNIVLRDNISEMIVTSTRELQGDIFQGVMDAYERGVTIIPMPILYERLTGRVPVEHVNNDWAVVLPIGGSSIFNPYPLLKRLFDLTLAFIGLGFFLVMLPFLIVIIWLDSPGNPFYTQVRVGLNGRVFRMIKFRTMIPDAEKHTGAVWAEKDDPRVTRFGKIMRKTRIDELPQLLNVFKGDMSLVGPRPERPQHVHNLQKVIPFYRTRHIIRPGVTGWAQVRYGYGSTIDDARVKLQYDLYYIRHQSLLLDINIIIRTVGKVFKMAGR